MIYKSIPRPEHPRPLLQRDDWLNLNGEWQFAFDGGNRGEIEKWFDREELERPITVPYAYQTSLSGIDDKTIHEVVWYSRSFEVPTEWGDKDILLHFGAVDYKSTIWVNGQEVGMNQGGHVPFSFDITPYLSEGTNLLTVKVIDRQDPLQPRGKQSVTGKSEKIDYYCTTGIWQTVWLEAVPTVRIDDVRITPNVDQDLFNVTAILHAPTSRRTLEVIITDADGNLVVRDTKETTGAVISMRLEIHEPRLWSPTAPNLYYFEVRLKSGDEAVDCVRTYSGMRKISISGDTMQLNNKPLYLAMVLDQGYWPDGGMTAPTDDDLIKDIALIKQMGFNGVRKHQKIEDPRWLYWCDKLGLLVWGEMANAREWDMDAEMMLLAEWERAVRRDYNNPCIIAWVPMNESWGVAGLHDDHAGQYAYIERIVSTTRRLDATRPVIDNDGWEHTDITDICTLHDYTPTADSLKKRYDSLISGGEIPKARWLGDRIRHFARTSEYRGQPIIFSEIGGFLIVPPKLSQDKLDQLYEIYGNAKDPKDFLIMYEDLMEGIHQLPFLGGFCYTQLVDIEQEMNGLLTYDREPKFPIAKVAKWNKKLIESYIARKS